jgi:hypothetical protein
VDDAGVVHRIPRIDDARLEEIFAREMLAMLVRKERLSPEWAERVILLEFTCLPAGGSPGSRRISPIRGKS